MAELICIYGGTGSWKTAQVHFLAKYIYERYGKITRLASCDGGGWKPLEPDIAAHIIEAWSVSAIENPRSVLRKLSQGFWPEVVTKDGRMQLVLRPPDAKTWDKVGAEACEGLTSVANVIMRDALNKQLKVAADEAPAAFKESITVEGLDGRPLAMEEKYSFAARGNYNDAQRAVYDICTNFRSLPCPYVYFSALETRGEEEDTKKTIIGPAVIGKAVTAQVGSWVGDLIHAEDYFVEEDDPLDKRSEQELKQSGAKRRRVQKTKVRMWFLRHPDSITGALFPAKPRVAPEMIPELLKIYPGGYFEPTTEAGLDAYLKAVEALQDVATNKLSKWKAEVDARKAAEKVGGTDAPKAPKELVEATTGGKI